MSDLRFDANLLGRYTFQKPSDLGLDTSPPAARSGYTVGTGVTSALDGTRGRVLSLGGAGYIQVDNTFGAPNTNVALCGWVNVASTPASTKTIASLCEGICLRVIAGSTSGKIKFVSQVFLSVGGSRLITSGDFNVGTWYHVAVVFNFNASTERYFLCVNGVRIDFFAFAGAILYNTLPLQTQALRIGQTADNTSALTPLTGLIDDVRLYNRSLSVAEVVQIYQEQAIFYNFSTNQTYPTNLTMTILPMNIRENLGDDVAVTLTMSDTSAGSINIGSSGTVSSTFNSGVWSASGAINDVNTLLANLVFTPALNFTGSFGISNSIVDTGTTYTPTARIVSNQASGSAPTATGMSTNQPFDYNTNFGISQISVTDADSGTVSARLTLSSPNAGFFSTPSTSTASSSFDAATGVWTASGSVVNLNALLGSLTFTASSTWYTDFTITTLVTDGNSSTSGSKLMTINRATVGTGAASSSTLIAQSYTEDTQLPMSTIGITSSFPQVQATYTGVPSGSTISATSNAATSSFSSGTWTVEGPLVDVNTVLGTLKFNPASNYNSSFTLTLTVRDITSPQTSDSRVYTQSFTGTAVNDEPTIAATADQTYEANTRFTLPALTVADVDTATVTLSITLSDPQAGQLLVVEGLITTPFTNPLTDTPANIHDLVLAYQPARNYVGSFTMTIDVFDGALSASADVDYSRSGGLLYVTQTGAETPQTYYTNTPLPLTLVTLASDYTNVRARYTGVPSGASISTATSGTVTSTFNSGTGTWTAQGPLDDVNALLEHLMYTPAPNSTPATVNLTFGITDITTPSPDELTVTKTLTGVEVVQEVICLAAETKLLLATKDNQMINIEHVRPGMVLRRSPHSKFNSANTVRVKRVLLCYATEVIYFAPHTLHDRQHMPLITSLYHMVFNSRTGQWGEARHTPRGVHLHLTTPIPLYNVQLEEGWSTFVAENVLCESCAVSPKEIYKRKSFIAKWEKLKKFQG